VNGRCSLRDVLKYDRLGLKFVIAEENRGQKLRQRIEPSSIFWERTTRSDLMDIRCVQSVGILSSPQYMNLITCPIAVLVRPTNL
jgi:hypothetical protein